MKFLNFVLILSLIALLGFQGIASECNNVCPPNMELVCARNDNGEIRLFTNPCHMESTNCSMNETFVEIDMEYCQ